MNCPAWPEALSQTRISLSELTAVMPVLQASAGDCGNGINRSFQNSLTTRPTLHLASSRSPARPPGFAPPDRSSQNAAVADGLVMNWHAAYADDEGGRRTAAIQRIGHPKWRPSRTAA